jgi:streptomycin 3"-adenylyltransferase
MALFGWDNCPGAVRAQVDHLTTTLSGALAERLIGIYLHGSLAMGCFNPYHSDLDLLVITDSRMPVATKRRTVEFLLGCSNQPHPIEISFLASAQLRPWQYPTPFDLHYSEMWRATYTHELAAGTWQAWNDTQQRDPDLAAHITIINARGIRLMGAPIASTFPSAPDDDYRASLAGDIHDSLESIATDPVYAILNCCRTYAYVRDGRVLSKEEGGRWAVDALPAAFGDTITAAWAAYRSDTGRQRFDADALNAFAIYMRQVLAPVLRHRTLARS